MSRITGLIFPSNPDIANSNAESVRFRWTNPQSNGLPIYGAGGAGVTYIWRLKPIQQSGYYTTFFWGNDDGAGSGDTFLWHTAGTYQGDTYYGCHPYPDTIPNGAAHSWEIAVEQNDIVNGAVVKDVWYTQACIAEGAANAVKNETFYWDLPNVDAGHKVTRSTPSTFGNLDPPSPALTFGDAPWAPGNECLSGTLRGLQIYSVKLSEADILSEVASPLSTSAGAAGIWYLNLNPTPDDISDKSGAGHHPAWFNASKTATLFSEGSDMTPTGFSGDLSRRKFGRTL